jgi:hypothetical protein
MLSGINRQGHRRHFVVGYPSLIANSAKNFRHHSALPDLHLLRSLHYRRGLFI